MKNLLSEKNPKTMDREKNVKRIAHLEEKETLETAIRDIEQQDNSSVVDIIFMKKYRYFVQKIK